MSFSMSTLHLQYGHYDLSLVKKEGQQKLVPTGAQAEQYTPQGLVVILSTVFEGSYWPRNDSWKLGVHGQERVIVHNVANDPHFFFQVVLPYFSHP